MAVKMATSRATTGYWKTANHIFYPAVLETERTDGHVCLQVGKEAYPEPLQTILLPVRRLLVLHRERGEEDVPVLRAWRDELAQQQEKGTQADGLDRLEPRVEVHLGRRETDGEEGDDGPERDDERYTQDPDDC